VIIVVDAFSVGREIGRTISESKSYREDFVESQEVVDLLLANLEDVYVTGVLKVIINYYDVDGLVWNHPVRGDLNVFKWNATYSSEVPGEGEFGWLIVGENVVSSSEFNF
jgi:hypothetical protein